MQSTLKSVLGLVGWLALCFAVSAVGALGSMNAPAFYGQLVQPSWAPPPWLFGPVWTLLYAMMGVAAWLVWRAGGWAKNRLALSLFLIQLALNGLWSWLFFAWQLGAWAMADIAALWVLILLTLIAFWRVRPWAGMLLLPYLLWVGFASALNFNLWQNNPFILG